MRLMSYNIEWFDDWFSDDNTMKTSAEAITKFDAIADVLTAIDPDVIGITEGPNTTTTTGNRSTVAALEGFAAAKSLRQSKAMIGFPSGGRQEIAVLYDPTVASVTHDAGGSAGSKSNPPFKEQFQIDSDQDGIKEVYKHYRPPLEAKVVRADGGADFWMIVAHAKSKGIFSAMDRLNFDRTSDRNRRKLFAECSSIRRRVEDWLEDNRPTIVMGDINDGPGFDFYESRFGRSAVEIILGDVFDRATLLSYPIGRPKFGRYGWEPSTARFTDNYTGDRVNALIDHIMASSHFSLTGSAPAMVWNPYQLDAAKPLKSSLLGASDHFPVTLDIA
ncbi:Endonuclease/Exonuclease/phosphatase family protein [Shimia sp. SK013]|uniref:endonuclease/exonuclease/phosphatase family protein n=1 Tax=Shimia sp. SK013 TaxID=1389006 RepID=UPI0006CDA3C9|nr:endonuclease/exonuclease/phosphatase family protein [Shimia sp. SK013]KPA23676.1 Endonuclease/Exonuclease/phosphatase family protein [Shimia sp. SK013]